MKKGLHRSPFSLIPLIPLMQRIRRSDARQRATLFGQSFLTQFAYSASECSCS